MATELPDVEVVEVFVVDEHGQLVAPLPPSDTADPRAVGEAIARQLRDVKATPGHRIGKQASPVVRNGLGEDISQPVLAPADRVLDRMFGEPALLDGLPALHIAGEGSRGDDHSATWPVALDTGPPSGRRDAVLAIHASPSQNLTILELVPSRPRRFRTKTFVRLGVTAIAELATRLRIEPEAA